MKMYVPEHSSSGGSPDEFLSKNRLQEYTQKASLSLPVYQTFTEGAPHAPNFRSQVWVDGERFISPNTFSSKKMAEQDAAKHALIGIREKIKNEGPSRVLEDTVFCKSIINEYALKMNMNPPTYATNGTEAFIPMFVSSLELNGVTYTGQAAKNKKEAEQLAARSAILSILGSEPSTTMCEIVKSKFKFYDALKKVKDPHNVVQDSSTISTEAKPAEDLKDSYTVQGAINPSQDSGAILSSVNKNNEVHVDGNTVTAEIPQSSSVSFGPIPGIQQKLVPESTMEPPMNTQVQSEPVHVFKKPKLQNSPSAIVPPVETLPPAVVPCIKFVLPAAEQDLACSASGRKQNRKKKKSKKNGQNQSELVAAKIPQSSAPAYPVAQ